jgi:hypothetical protein
MRAIVAIVFLFVLASPAHAARTFPLDRFRIEVYRNGRATTISQYLMAQDNVRYATTTTFSNRQGAPVGLFILSGYVHQGSWRRRCFFQVDRTGRRVYIGYQLQRWAFHAFEAGPCIVRWQKGKRWGTYIAEREERFSHAFVTAPAERSVLCLDKPGRKVTLFRFYGSLWLIAGKIAHSAIDRCINLDGGGQLAADAVNPAILGIVYDPTGDASASGH